MLYKVGDRVQVIRSEFDYMVGQKGIVELVEDRGYDGQSLSIDFGKQIGEATSTLKGLFPEKTGRRYISELVKLTELPLVVELL